MDKAFEFALGKSRDRSPSSPLNNSFKVLFYNHIMNNQNPPESLERFLIKLANSSIKISQEK